MTVVAHTEADNYSVTTFHVPEADHPRFLVAVQRQGGEVAASAPSGVMGPSYYVTVRFPPVPDSL